MLGCRLSEIKRHFHFGLTNRDLATWSLLSRARSISVVRHFSFESIEQAIQQLLQCQAAAESFLSAEHTVRGEIEDGLAQAYATLGMAGVLLPCRVFSAALPSLFGSLLPSESTLFSLPFCIPHPQSLRLIRFLFWNETFLFSQGTG